MATTAHDKGRELRAKERDHVQKFLAGKLEMELRDPKERKI